MFTRVDVNDMNEREGPQTSPKPEPHVTGEAIVSFQAQGLNNGSASPSQYVWTAVNGLNWVTFTVQLPLIKH